MAIIVIPSGPPSSRVRPPKLAGSAAAMTIGPETSAQELVRAVFEKGVTG